MRHYIKYIIPIASLFLSACSPTINNDAPTPQREIIHISANPPQTTIQSPPQTTLPAGKHPDGTLTNKTPCNRLIDNAANFSTNEAQSAWLSYTQGNFITAARQLKDAAQQPALPPEESQQLLFLAALATQKIPNDSQSGNPAAESIALLKTAFHINAPLQNASAVYGTKLGYQAKQWQDVIDFTSHLLNREEFRTYRSIALTNLGQYDAACAEFERIEKYPKNIRLDALQAKARAQSETAQLKSALETYRRIYEIDPNSTQGQLAQDAIMAQKNRWPAGFTFPRAPQKIDKSKSAREIAQAHFDAHRSEKAIAAFSKLYKDDKQRKDTPRMCDDLYAIARSYVKLREHSKSLPHFKDALTLCKSTKLHVKILYSAAKAAWNAGQNDLALSWYDDITTQYPAHSYADDAYLYQAQIFLSQQNPDNARKKLNEQISKYPDGDMAADAYWMLLSDLYDRGDFQNAVKFVDKHISHAAESDLYTQGRMRYFQARAYENINATQQALQNYIQIMEAFPLSYYAMLSLGRLEAIAPSQAQEWLAAYRTDVFTPDQAADYCFQVIPNDNAFKAARALTKFGLYDEALNEIDAMMQSNEPRVTYEAKLARAMILQKAGRFTDSARLAASLLNPTSDIVSHAYAPWLLAYPKPWEDIVKTATQNQKRLYYTTYAIMREESYYNPRAESWANARGLMQLMLPTAQSTAAEIGLPKPSPNALFNPQTAIPIGAAYIAKLYKILAPHPMFVLPGYNAGQGNVGKWMKRFASNHVDEYVEKIPFKEARHYAKRVGTTLWRYQWLYDKDMPNNFDPAAIVGDL